MSQGTYRGPVTQSARELLAAIIASMAGSTRPHQEQMADAVASAIDGGGVLLVQAGTGTGKSLGYLAPAISAARNSGTRTVVSTATLALQRQLVDKDLPAALAAAPEPQVTAAVLKGRGNYICAARLAGQGSDDPQEELDLSVGGGRMERQAAELRSWAQSTSTGDRDDYSEQLDPRVWRALSATGRECVGPSRCSFAAECFSEKARHRAGAADIVVTNHALLALDALDDAALLPEYDVLIVDEGHELGARVAAAGTEQLGAGLVDRAVAAVRPLVDADHVERLTEAGAAFSAALSGLPVERRRMTAMDEGLVSALALLRDACTLAGAALPREEDSDNHRRHRAQAALTEVHDIAGRLIGAGEDDVVWYGGLADPQLHVAPLGVAGPLGEYLTERGAAVVTSATLTLGGDFDAVAAELGLRGEWDGLDVGSPFDYRHQGILYAAADLPAPGRDGPDEALLDRVRELVVAAGGRSLVLLSSWRAVERVSEHLLAQPVPGVDVLVQQRGDPVAGLVSRFAEDETSVLVGTMSLFQGVDVPGSSCLCVIIDRIPFPRPDDPVLQARAERVARAGGNGFMSVSVPRAALLLAQGAGRLIRSDSDRGVVAVLDPRLATARYGSYLVASLPDFWPTTRREVAVEALRRLSGSL